MKRKSDGGIVGVRKKIRSHSLELATTHKHPQQNFVKKNVMVTVLLCIIETLKRTAYLRSDYVPVSLGSNSAKGGAFIPGTKSGTFA